MHIDFIYLEYISEKGTLNQIKARQSQNDEKSTRK